MVPLWLFLLVCGLLVATLVYFKGPIPFRDIGHRIFLVPNDKAARAVADVLGRTADMGERFTFDSGPTHQTLLSDGGTVLMSFDEEMYDRGLAMNGMSYAVSDPFKAAGTAVELLKQYGFKAEVHCDVDPALGDKLVLVTTDALCGAAIVFRRHVLRLGRPKMYRLLTS